MKTCKTILPASPDNANILGEPRKGRVWRREHMSQGEQQVLWWWLPGPGKGRRCVGAASGSRQAPSWPTSPAQLTCLLAPCLLAPCLLVGLPLPSSVPPHSCLIHSLSKHCLAPGTVLSPATETKSWLSATPVPAGLFASIHATMGGGLRKVNPTERPSGCHQPRVPHLGPVSPACSWPSSLVSP